MLELVIPPHYGQVAQWLERYAETGVIPGCTVEASPRQSLLLLTTGIPPLASRHACSASGPLTGT